MWGKFSGKKNSEALKKIFRWNFIIEIFEYRAVYYYRLVWLYIGTERSADDDLKQTETATD